VNLKLDELAKQLGVTKLMGPTVGEVIDVTHDSRQVKPGTAFVAISGAQTDGNRFVSQAIEAGAVCVISEQPTVENSSIPWITISDARAALARASALVHGSPSRRLRLVAVTGTNGKTTTTYLVDSIIREAEGTSAMISTIRYGIGGHKDESHHTTPEASDIQRVLSQAVESGCKSAVVEISSHAIELKRANDLSFAAAVFTNLTRDHLDFHKTMEAYFDAKKKLFDGRLGAAPKVSCINIDDDFGRKLVGSAGGRVITYGLSAGADVKTEGFKLGDRGLEFTAKTPSGDIEISSSLTGRPHVYNILAAVSAGLALEFDKSKIAEGIAECESVPGRFELVASAAAAGMGFKVVVDYAHTDDALKKVLQTAREVIGQQGRVITVFGCGGGRDRTKRPLMGEAAGALSDLAIVTSDNPRTEDPDAIIDDIEPGLRNTGRQYVRIADRRHAIFRAIREAAKGDIVVIAGKGHETYQVIGNTRHHFDDREVAGEALLEGTRSAEAGASNEA
jgi:UDP-N-acetylmuramoyl-L-alanyl-D-glutamate--2,6-diaminopimelate ligase